MRDIVGIFMIFVMIAITMAAIGLFLMEYRDHRDWLDKRRKDKEVRQLEDMLK